MSNGRRMLRRWLLLGGILLIFLCLGGMAYLITSYPILGSTAVSTPPIIWTSLPTPSVVHSNVVSYSSARQINGLARRDGLIWAASDGGLLVWQESDPATAVKFTSEHGLAENRTTSVATGLDGSIWVGTASAGVSRYDGVTWQTFTTADGLPGNAVRDLVVAADGAVWVATSNGIGRYDGRRWFSYNRSRTLLQLPSNNVTSLALAADGVTIYAGTSEGVVQFNGRSWTSLTQIGSEAVNTVRDVVITPDGRLWAATQGGLSVYDGSRWQLFTRTDGLASDDVRTLAANADGSVWLGYGEQGLGLTRFELSGEIPAATAVSPPNEHIFAILPTGSDLWLGSADGLLRQGGAGSWQPFATPSEISSNDLVNLLIADGQPWLATANSISRFDGTAWELVEGLPETAVSSLNADNNGQLWVTFQTVGQGAASYDPASNAWQTVSCPVSGPASPYVRHIVQTADGRLWFATEAGLATLDPDTQRWSLFTQADGLPGNTVQALALHPGGSLWVGTREGLAVMVDGRFTIQNSDDIRELVIGPEGTVWTITADAVYRVRDGQTQQIAAPPVSQVYDVLAAPDGLWLAADEGIAFFDGAQSGNGRWLRFNSGEAGLPGNRVTALSLADDGTLWASSELTNQQFSNGLYGSYTIHQSYLSLFDGQQWQTAVRPTASGLLHPLVTSIATTPDGATWLATLAGISRLDGQTWTQFTPLDGLPAYEVYQLLAIEDTVWAVTKGGLAQFNPATQQWKSFAAAGDWPSFETVHLAANANGTVWAGSGTELRRYDGQQWQIVPIPLPDPETNVRDFVVAEDGRLLLTAHLETPTSEQHFLAEFVGQTWTWHELALPDSQFEPFSHLWLGPDGRLWASNGSSLWQFNLPAGNFTEPDQYPELIRGMTDLTFLPKGKPVAVTRFSDTPLLLEPEGSVPLEQPLAASDEFAIHATENGRLWLGTNRGAARQLDDGTWQAIPLTEAELAETTSALNVMPDGSVLLGGTNGSILRWADGQVSVVGNARGGDGAPISALFTAADGALWRSSFGSSVARLDENVWLPYSASPAIYTERVLETAVSDPTTIWLTTAEDVVSITTVGERTVCQRVTDEFPAAAGLTADLTGQLWLVSEQTVYRGNAAGFTRMGTLAMPITAVAPDGAVWYVTQSDVVRVQGDQRLPVAHNLDLDTITALAIGPDGAVWLGTTAGAKVLQGGQWRTLTAADGLASNHVTHIAIAADGSVWVGTLGGVSWVR